MEDAPLLVRLADIRSTPLSNTSPTGGKTGQRFFENLVQDQWPWSSKHGVVWRAVRAAHAAQRSKRRGAAGRLLRSKTRCVRGSDGAPHNLCTTGPVHRN